MSAPTSRQSYGDCYDLYDRAVDTQHGIRFRVESENAALHLRMRLNMARQIDRRDNRQIHKLGDPMFGSSIYDPVQVLIRADDDGIWWVYIEPRAAHIIGEIEELLPYEEPQWPQNSPPKLISHTGIALLEKKSDSTSNAPNEPSLSEPSMKLDKTLPILILRRL